MNLANIVKEEVPEVDKDPLSKMSFMIIDAWKQFEFFCRNYLLSHLENHLYDIFFPHIKMQGSMGDACEKKNKIEDAGAKKFVIGKFLSIL